MKVNAARREAYVLVLLYPEKQVHDFYLSCAASLEQQAYDTHM